MAKQELIFFFLIITKYFLLKIQGHEGVPKIMVFVKIAYDPIFNIWLDLR